MFALKLHHIGVVVQNINESLGEIANFLNFESTSLPTLIGSQKVNICFLKTNNVYVELIEPAEENSPITNFAKEGGGFHHLCFEVDNIQQEIDKVRLEAGLKPTIKKSNESDKTQDVEEKTKPEMTQVMKNLENIVDEWERIEREE